jgi:hypothetical protein
MVAPVTVSEKDLRALLGMVTCGRDDLPPHGLPWSLLHDLMGQVRCDYLALSGVDTTRQEKWFGQDIPPDPDDQVSNPTFWEHFSDCEAHSYPDRTGDLRSVTKVSDFYSVRQWHSTGLYSDYYRPYGVEHLLTLVLPAGPGPVPRTRADPAASTLPRPRARVFRTGPGAAGPATPAPAPGLPRRRTAPPRQPAADPAALGVAAPGRRRAHQHPDRPAARRDRRNSAHPPAEHLRQAAGIQPHRRGDQSLPRPGSRLIHSKITVPFDVLHMGRQVGTA